jgi:hypothetical protein
MTGISLHMQQPLPSQLYGSQSQREQLFFVTNQTPRPKIHFLTFGPRNLRPDDGRREVVAQLGPQPVHLGRVVLSEAEATVPNEILLDQILIKK